MPDAEDLKSYTVPVSQDRGEAAIILGIVSNGFPLTSNHQTHVYKVVERVPSPLPVTVFICTNHYLMCRTMTDELMACLVISWLAGDLSSPEVLRMQSRA
jgi:hypothetical protein